MLVIEQGREGRKEGRERREGREGREGRKGKQKTDKEGLVIETLKSEVRRSWIGIQTCSLTNCMNLGKLLNLSISLSVLKCKMGIISLPIMLLRESDEKIIVTLMNTINDTEVQSLLSEYSESSDAEGR